jgi:hypothetical protein
VSTLDPTPEELEATLELGSIERAAGEPARQSRVRVLGASER